MTFCPPRRLILSTLAFAALVQFGGCATSTSGPSSALGVIGQNTELSTFNQLVQQAGLQDVLKGDTAVTVFAPDNAAFKAVPAASLDKLANDPAALKALLMHHIVAGTTDRASLKSDSAVVTTMAGGKVTIAKAGDFITVDESLVTQADLRASNGVVHVVDRVLTAPKK